MLVENALRNRPKAVTVPPNMVATRQPYIFATALPKGAEEQSKAVGNYSQVSEKWPQSV